MEKFYNQIDGLFTNGVISGVISILIAGFLLLIANKLLNKVIYNKWPENNITQKRIKKILLVCIFMSIMCNEIKFLKDMICIDNGILFSHKTTK